MDYMGFYFKIKSASLLNSRHVYKINKTNKKKILK